jgi:Bucentaur or craniofacial development
MSHPPPSSSSKAVDEAFQRIFGYAWGTELVIDNDDSLPKELIQIFGSKQKVAQILRLPSIGGGGGGDVPKDAARLLTQPIVVVTTSSGKRKGTTSNFTIKNSNSHNNNFKRRRRLEDQDYKNIELPKDVVASLSASKTAEGITSESAASQKAASTAATAKNNSSNLDSVLQQLAGAKKPNTVEKTNEDWESFKETDKTLQDELERTAQSKNAYLVKQDFLNRVDQRRFEIEKSERDQERARRATASGK